MKWVVDGLLIGTLDAGANGAFSAAGKVALGYSDPTTNGSDNAPLSFALVDNLVISVPEPMSGFPMLVAGISLMESGRLRWRWSTARDIALRSIGTSSTLQSVEVVSKDNVLEFRNRTAKQLGSAEEKLAAKKAKKAA